MKMIRPPSNRWLLTLLFVVVVAATLASGEVGVATNEGECSAEDDESCNAEPASSEVLSVCEDKEEKCGHWASLGECEKNPKYMLVNCAVSCDSCPEQRVISAEERELLAEVAKYGEKQRVEGVQYQDTLDVIKKTVAYMQNDVHGPNAKHQLSETLLGECINKDELCAFWAASGECDANLSYMQTKCAPSCQSCHMIDIDSRCPPLGDDVQPALLPGGLNAMFERIVATAPGNQTEAVEIEENMTNYSVVVHSRPEPFTGEPSRERDFEQPPWIITFEDFLTAEECEHLIKMGYNANYERSKDVGVLQNDGTYSAVESATRTSENAWCSDRNDCRKDEVVKRIHQRIAKVTGIGPEHSEDFQILKYVEGQFYRPHHDYIHHQKDRHCGPRILTFFLYLSDVEEGGATNFVGLKLPVKPKLGRALLWPSVLDSDPMQKDPRTDHEAQDVIAGTKFGANAWLHMYDYMAAQARGCT